MHLLKEGMKGRLKNSHSVFFDGFLSMKHRLTKRCNPGINSVNVFREICTERNLRYLESRCGRGSSVAVIAISVDNEVWRCGSCAFEDFSSIVVEEIECRRLKRRERRSKYATNARDHRKSEYSKGSRQSGVELHRVA